MVAKLTLRAMSRLLFRAGSRQILLAIGPERGWDPGHELERCLHPLPISAPSAPMPECLDTPYCHILPFFFAGP